ncbi:MAG: right-handed parallel beta-helix repeat-containing protein, partial [bacterium]
MKRQIFVSLVVLGVVLGVRVYATDLYVPGSYTTIQAAINAATTGDTVWIDPGTYTGPGNKNLDFSGKAIYVRAKAGAENTVIDCEGSGRGFYFHSSETSASIVDGFTVKNGYVTGDWPSSCGGGILCYFSSPIITNCILLNNTTTWYGGGIYCYNSSPTITNCTISNNTTNWKGGGISCYNSSSIITSCTISGNTVISGNGGGIASSESSLSITNCTVIGNIANIGAYGGGHAGGILCHSSSSSITNCIILENIAGSYYGGGIDCVEHDSSIITNCIISRNQAYLGGGGIYCDLSSPSLINCVIIENQTQYNTTYGGGRGGGILCHSSSPSIINCTISENMANYNDGGGIGVYDNSFPSIVNCIISGNTTPFNGGGIACDNPSLTISYDNFWNNSPQNYYGITDQTGINGNICLNPQFVSTSTGNYRLQSSSPCIDAGSNDAVPTWLTTDKDGNPRIADGDGDNIAIVDMGAYEYQGSPTQWVDVWINKYGSYQIAEGENIIYRIYYGNGGDKKASSVEIRDILSSGLTYGSDTSGITPTISGNEIKWAIGTLSALEQRYFELICRVGSQINNVTNIIEITSPEDLISHNNTFTLKTQVISWYADLYMSKWATNDATDRIFRSGHKIFYHISYGNSGSAKANSVKIIDYFPQELVPVSATLPGGICDLTAHTITWNIGDLMPGKYGEIVITCMVKQEATGQLVNTADISSLSPERNYLNNTYKMTVTVEQAYDPNEKLVDRQYIYPDEVNPLTYVIHFENLATASASARDIQVGDHLDPNLDWSTFNVIRMPGLGPNGTWTLSSTGTAYWFFDEIYLATGSTEYIVFQIKPKLNLTPNTEISNYATVQFDLEPSMDTPVVIVRVIEPKITVFPNKGSVGSLVTISGYDFYENSQISVDFGTHPTIAITTSNEYGSFSLTFIVDTQPICTKIITATDESGETATAIFLLTPNPKIDLLNPTSGNIGTIVTIEGDGFGPNTPVNIAFGTNQNIANTFSSDQGTFSTIFVVDTQEPCTKTITASGDSYIGEVFATTTFKLIGIPGISLTKTGPTTTTTLSTITYTLSYTNTGQTTLCNVNLI